MFKRKVHIEIMMYNDVIVVTFVRYGTLTSYYYGKQKQLFKDLSNGIDGNCEIVAYDSLREMASDILDYLTIEGVDVVTTNSFVNLGNLIKHDSGIYVDYTADNRNYETNGFDVFTMQNIMFIEQEGHNYYRVENILFADAIKLMYAKEEFVKELSTFNGLTFAVYGLLPLYLVVEGFYICQYFHK